MALEAPVKRRSIEKERETGLEPATACLEGRCFQHHRSVAIDWLYRLIYGPEPQCEQAEKKCSQAMKPVTTCLHKDANTCLRKDATTCLRVSCRMASCLVSYSVERKAKHALGTPMPGRTGSLLEYSDVLHVYHLDPWSDPG